MTPTLRHPVTETEADARLRLVLEKAGATPEEVARAIANPSTGQPASVAVAAMGDAQATAAGIYVPTTGAAALARTEGRTVTSRPRLSWFAIAGWAALAVVLGTLLGFLVPTP